MNKTKSPVTNAAIQAALEMETDGITVAVMRLTPDGVVFSWLDIWHDNLISDKAREAIADELRDVADDVESKTIDEFMRERR